MNVEEEQVLNQYEENSVFSNGSSEKNGVYTVTDFLLEDDAPVWTPVTPLDEASKDRDSRKVKNLKAKIDHVVTKSALLKESLILDHKKSLKTVADDCKTYSIKISDLEQKHIRLTEKILCAKSTHLHQIEMLKQSNISKLKKIMSNMGVSLISFNFFCFVHQMSNYFYIFVLFLYSCYFIVSYKKYGAVMKGINVTIKNKTMECLALELKVMIFPEWTTKEPEEQIDF